MSRTRTNVYYVIDTSYITAVGLLWRRADQTGVDFAETRASDRMQKRLEGFREVLKFRSDARIQGKF